MSAELMNTEVGGEQTQYESIDTTNTPQKKSGGQLGDSETTMDPSQTSEGADRLAEKGDKAAENIRYGQGISEQGMGGVTTGQSGESRSEGFGGVRDESREEGSEGAKERAVEGYGEGSGVGA